MRYLPLLAMLVFLSGCSETSQPIQKNNYFDLKGFFESEIRRLETLKPEVEKTVSRNGSKESKVLSTINWKTELSLFVESDINKPAWSSSYKVTNNGLKTIYKANDPQLRTQEIILEKDGKGDLKNIQIKNKSANMLYNTSERLLYIRDSVYRISKDQHVTIIGDNRYTIEGSF